MQYIIHFNLTLKFLVSLSVIIVPRFQLHFKGSMTLTFLVSLSVIIVPRFQ